MPARDQDRRRHPAAQDQYGRRPWRQFRVLGELAGARRRAGVRALAVGVEGVEDINNQVEATSTMIDVVARTELRYARIMRTNF